MGNGLFGQVFGLRKVGHVEVKYRASLLIDWHRDSNSFRLQHVLHKATVIFDENYFCAVVFRSCSFVPDGIRIIKPHKSTTAIISPAKYLAFFDSKNKILAISGVSAQ